MGLEYTSYEFRPPAKVTEEWYGIAKNHPAEWRQSVNLHLRSSFKSIGVRSMLMCGLGGAIIFIVCLFGCLFGLEDKEGGFATALLLGFAIAGLLTIASGILTAVSFFAYATTCRRFWMCVAATARESNSYSDSLLLFEKRRKSDLDRKISPRFIGISVIVAALGTRLAILVVANM